MPILPINIDNVKMFWFSKLQEAIIAFKNEDQVTAFGFFDLKNAERTQQISELILQQKTNLESVKVIMSHVKKAVDQNQAKVEEFLRMHEEVEKLKLQLMEAENNTSAPDMSMEQDKSK